MGFRWVSPPVCVDSVDKSGQRPGSPCVAVQGVRCPRVPHTPQRLAFYPLASKIHTTNFKGFPAEGSNVSDSKSAGHKDFSHMETTCLQAGMPFL